MSVRASAWLSLAVLGLAVACAPSDDEPGTPHIEGFDIFMDGVIREAERSTAVSEDQWRILRQAQEEGHVTQAHVREAISHYIDCLSDYGMSYVDHGPVSEAQYARFEGLTWAGDQESQMEACYDAEYTHVDWAYQGQPAAIAERRAITERALPQLRACLRDAGYSAPESLTYDETIDIAFFATTGAALTDDSLVPQEEWRKVDCFGTVGLSFKEVEWRERPRPRS